MWIIGRSIDVVIDIAEVCCEAEAIDEIRRSLLFGDRHSIVACARRSPALNVDFHINAIITQVLHVAHKISCDSKIDAGRLDGLARLPDDFLLFVSDASLRLLLLQLLLRCRRLWIQPTLHLST